MSPPRNICGARNRQGLTCRKGAGWGTDHPGAGRCKLHGGNAGAPPGEENGRFVHGLRAKYLKVEDLAEVYPDPAERMKLLANLMANRAIAAHQAVTKDAEQDTDATDARIARAVRTAAQATRVELAALKAKAEGAAGDDDNDIARDDTFIAPDEPVPDDPIL